MIKKNFLSGLGAKLALAVVALTTATFTSCENEDFDVKVVYNPAEVNIIPDVTYIDLEAGTSQDVTNLATIEYTNATKEGNIGVIKGTEAAPSIAATTVTVKASYNGIETTKNVAISAIKTGKITYPVALILIKNKVGGDYTLEIVEGEATQVGEIEKNYADFNGHNYNHNGLNYYENPSEYIVKIKVTANITEKSEITNSTVYQEEVDAADLIKSIETIENAYNWSAPKEKTLTATFEASAYSLFYAWVEMTTSKMNVDIVKKEEGKENAIVATFTVEYTSSSAIQKDEIAHPSHAGHYHAGHGHGHGHGAGNAGGGIIVAD